MIASSPIGWIGNSAVLVAVGCALFGIIAFYAARRIASPVAAGVGRGAVYATFIFMTIATLAMLYALLHDDFSVSYVAQVGSRQTPRWISVVSLWSSLEGSILFWGWLLAAYSAVCIYLHRGREDPLMPWVGLTLLTVQLFFYLLLAMPANPFVPIDPAPSNGPGPNPLLQNHWLMAIHPPCLYIGYIGFTIPFAFAVAALIETDRSGTWLAITRRWTLFAWSFLSIAIVLGGWWSYAVLGWGGYWAWDPVENASFMPWLTGTAFIHSVMVQEKRKILPVWNLFLALLTFLLTLLGTFLTRSGVLESVHSFTESRIGPYFLIAIGIVLSVSVALLLWQGPKFHARGKIESLFSLEVCFLFNNLLFISFCFIVFLGTLYPLVVEAVSGTRLSVGEPYFDRMTIPIVGMALLLMNVALVTPWRKGTAKGSVKVSRWPVGLAMVTTAGATWYGADRPVVLGLIFLASWGLFVMALEMCRGGWRKNARRYAGFIAHIGALIIIVAVTISATYKQESEVTLKAGETGTVKGYTFTLIQIEAAETPQRFEVRARIGVSRGDKSIGSLTPQLNYYPNAREPIATPAVRSTLVADLYLAPINVEKDGSAASIRVIVQPAVAWIWIGGAIVMVGGLIAMAVTNRYRIPTGHSHGRDQ